jgi:hypothetical protein
MGHRDRLKATYDDHFIYSNIFQLCLLRNLDQMFCIEHGIHTRLDIFARMTSRNKIYHEQFQTRRKTWNAQTNIIKRLIRTEYTGKHHLLQSEIEPPHRTVNAYTRPRVLRQLLSWYRHLPHKPAHDNADTCKSTRTNKRYCCIYISTRDSIYSDGIGSYHISQRKMVLIFTDLQEPTDDTVHIYMNLH